METVTIGTRRLPVVAQRHARLRRKLSVEDFQSILTKDYSHEAYRVLGILIPALVDGEQSIPEWEWDGFKQRVDWEKWKSTGTDPRTEEQADEEDNLSPTTAEVIAAFEAAFNVSGAGRMGKIVDLVLTGSKAAQKQVDSPTPASPALPGATGE